MNFLQLEEQYFFSEGKYEKLHYIILKEE